MSRDCCRPDYDALFDGRAARRELKAYRRKGAEGTTRRLVDAIRAHGLEGATVLDIGGGVGVIGAELLAFGASALTDVDASGPYLAAARSEIEPADVVTLDRVVCCYDDWEALVSRSTGRARRLYGLVIPRDRWWMRVAIGTVRTVGRLFGQAFPFHVHPELSIDDRIRNAGFERVFARRGLAWQTILYRRIA